MPAIAYRLLAPTRATNLFTSSDVQDLAVGRLVSPGICIRFAVGSD